MSADLPAAAIAAAAAAIHVIRIEQGASPGPVCSCHDVRMATAALAAALPALTDATAARRDEPVVTTTMFTEPEQAAWRVAVDRGLAIEAADVRHMLSAALPALTAPAAAQVIRDEAARWRDSSIKALDGEVAAEYGYIAAIIDKLADLLAGTADGAHPDGGTT